VSAGALCIELRDLVIRYGDVVAVNGVSFDVDRGEHVTLLGPSGCGKTTTLRAIAGLEQPVAATSPPSSAASRWCSNPTRCGRT
jgi:ABC-type Fe3+/spermidine/putrescine transport system ATPase subunit